MRGKSQTATEYLVIVAVVIIIALVVVGALGGIPGLGGETSAGVSKQVLATKEVGILEFAVFSQLVKVKLRNNEFFAIEVNSITIDEETCYPAPGINIPAGKTTDVFLACDNMIYKAEGENYNYDVTIAYTDVKTGASYTIDDNDFTLVGESAGSSTLMFSPHMTMGEYHACAADVSGTTWCWGRNNAGQLGRGDQVDVGYPIETSATSIEGVAAGQFHSCAVLSTGAMQCWGDNAQGQLGDGNNPTDQSSPVSVTGISTATVAAAGEVHSCARLRNGGVRCWGDNSQGQLGNGGTPTDSGTAVSVTGITTATDVSGGQYHTCALLSTSAVSCWGDNSQGQLGNGGSPTDSGTPVSVSSISTATHIDAGSLHACAVLANGAVQCWGDNVAGQLGNGNTGTDEDEPVSVTGISTARQVAAGLAHSCAVLTTGKVECWGDNSQGQLGDGNNPTDSNTPVEVTGITNAISISANRDNTCVVLANGRGMCWGDNTYGQLGNDYTGTDSGVPVYVLLGTSSTAQ